MIAGKYFNPDGSVLSRYKAEYEFDEKDNWIKYTSFIDGAPDTIYEREIEYFD